MFLLTNLIILLLHAFSIFNLMYGKDPEDWIQRIQESCVGSSKKFVSVDFDQLKYVTYTLCFPIGYVGYEYIGGREPDVKPKGWQKALKLVLLLVISGAGYFKAKSVVGNEFSSDYERLILKELLPVGTAMFLMSSCSKHITKIVARTH